MSLFVVVLCLVIAGFCVSFLEMLANIPYIIELEIETTDGNVAHTSANLQFQNNTLSCRTDMK